MEGGEARPPHTILYSVHNSAVLAVWWLMIVLYQRWVVQLHGSLLRCGGLTAVLVGGQRNIHHAGGPHLVVLKTKNFFEDLVLPRDRIP